MLQGENKERLVNQVLIKCVKVISVSKQEQRILGGTLMVAKSKVVLFSQWKDKKTNRNMHDQI